MTGQVLPGKNNYHAWSHAYVQRVARPLITLFSSQKIRSSIVLTRAHFWHSELHAVGRLAEYRYYDMDGVVASALELST